MGFSTHLKGTAFDSALATFMKHLCNHIYISRLLRLAFLEFEYERGRERGRKKKERKFNLCIESNYYIYI